MRPYTGVRPLRVCGAGWKLHGAETDTRILDSKKGRMVKYAE